MVRKRKNPHRPMRVFWLPGVVQLVSLVADPHRPRTVFEPTLLFGRFEATVARKTGHGADSNALAAMWQ